MINKEKILIIGIFTAIIGINLFFGLPRISKYTAVDETLWSYDRVPKFWRSVKKANWRGTSLCDKPGITLAMVSGLGLPFIPDPQDYEDLRYRPKSPQQIATIEKIYYSLRLPIYLFALASLPIFYFLLKRLLGMRTALFSTIFIGLSPIILGISLIINTDALLWILMPITILSFLIYQKEENQKFLYLTGFLLGIGILDKFVANFLFPFFLILTFLKYILGNYSNKKEDGIAYFKKAMSDYLMIVGIALLTIFIFYPSAWIKPKELLNTTIYSLAFKKLWPFFVGALASILMDVFAFKSRISRTICDILATQRKIFIQIILVITLLLIAFVLLNTYTGMRFFNFEEILANPKADLPFFQEFFPNLLASFFPLIYGLTPLVAFLFALTIALLLKISKNKMENDMTTAFCLLSFILVYYLANSLSEISSTVRYQIIIYPLASIIAAIGLNWIISSEKIKRYFSYNKTYFLIFLLIAASFISLYVTKPFFLAYSSSLLPKQYVLNLKDMGDASWEISQYLNNLPDANRLNVWSDKKQVCEKFIGKCDTGFNIKNIGDQHFDYFIASRGGRAETIARAANQKGGLFRIGVDTIDTNKLYSPSSHYDFKIIIDDRPNNYIKVVKSDTVAN